MQELLNITNADGEVITLMDGKITLGQAIAMVLTILAVVFILSVFKKAMKMVFTVIVVCVCLVYFNIASPAQIKDAATQIASAGIASYQALADSSKNIRLEGGSIQVNVDDTWVDISEVTSIIGGDSGKATVVVGGESFVIDDSALIELIKSFT